MTAEREPPPPKPFEVDLPYLRSHLDEMVESVFSDLQSQFLVLPRGKNLVTYGDFQAAYEVLKRHTSAFAYSGRNLPPRPGGLERHATQT